MTVVYNIGKKLKFQLMILSLMYKTFSYDLMIKRKEIFIFLRFYPALLVSFRALLKNVLLYILLYVFLTCSKWDRVITIFLLLC